MGGRVLVSMVLFTMDYDQLGTKPGHEAMDTKSGHEVWTRSHSESALSGDSLREASRPCAFYIVYSDISFQGCIFFL